MDRSALVVEDDSTTAHLFKKLLKNFGFTPLPATSCKHAADIISENNFTLALVDLHLPDGSGIELIELIATNSSCELVIATSATENLESVKKVKSLGAHEFLCKPFSYEQFSNLLFQHGFSDIVLPSYEVESESLQEVLLEFIDSLPFQVAELEKYVEGGDPKLISNSAHRMSSGAMFGFPEIAVLCKRLASSAKSFNRDETRLAIQELQELSRKIIAGRDVITKK